MEAWKTEMLLVNMETSLDKLDTKHLCHSFNECSGLAEPGLQPGQSLCPQCVTALSDSTSPAMESGLSKHL